MIGKFRSFSVQYLSVIGLILVHLVIACFLLDLGYLCGFSAVRLAWGVSFALCAGLSMMAGHRFCLQYLFAYAVLLLLTAFTFSYVDSDALTVHYPCQALMIDGWNPVYQRFPADILAYGVDSARWASYIAFMPKITATCGALISKSFHLFSADAFLGYVLCGTLFFMAWRFAHSFWPASGRFARFVFALALICNPQIVSVATGRVDYTAYASVVLLALTTALILSFDDKKAYPICGAALVVAATAKPFSLSFVVLSLCSLLVFGRRNRRVWMLLATSIVTIVVVGFSPIFTAWLTQDTINVTEDFVTNSDGARMGWISRVCYAWVSKWLAIKGCALVSGMPSFSPLLICQGGGDHEGFGVVFRTITCLSLFLILFTKRNCVFIISVTLFLASNLMPVRYIGYSRYAPAMWAFPCLVAYNFLYCARPCIEGLIFRRYSGILVIAMIAALAGGVAVRAFVMNLRLWAFEADRGQFVRQLAECQEVFSLPKTGNTYVMRRRLAVGGVHLAADGFPLAPIADLLVMDREDSEAKRAELEARFPFCNSIGKIVQFEWYSALSHFPCPILIK